MNKIKKFIFTLLSVCMILPALSPHPVFADAGGELAAGEQKITVTLRKPQEEPEAVTSVRFWLTVSVLEGQMQQPSFEFLKENSQSPQSGVRSAAVSGQDGSYLIDIIMSEKKDQDIFAGGDQAVIGTLNLHPSSKAFRIQAAFAGAPSSGSTQPVLHYISGTGYSMQTVPVLGTAPVICTDTASDIPSEPDGPSAPDTPSGPDGPSAPDQPSIPDLTLVPGYPVTPDQPSVPGNPVTPSTPVTPPAPDQPSGQPEPSEPDTTQPPEETQVFQKQAAPKLKFSAKNKSSRVSFQWNRIDGADGYQIYRYEEDTKRYTRVKTIASAKKTSFSKEMEYAVTYTFRLRAYQTAADGSRIYGKFSPSVKITTAPDKVTKLSVKERKPAKAALAWQPFATADGYQIYRSTKKNGTYTRLKTLKNAETANYSKISHKRGKTYYYKVRAYTEGADGVRRYGSFSSVKKLTVRY